MSSEAREDPLAEPTAAIGGLYVATVSIANLAIWVAFFTPLQNLLPRLSEQVAGDGKETALAIISGVGAFVAIIANPLAGALSDRTTSRFGRRRPWALGGALIGALAIAVLPFAGSILVLALLWAIAQGSINSAFAGVTASIPDHVPVRQRGVVSGWVGLSQSIGLVIGVAIVTILVTALRPGTWLTALLFVLLVVPFVVTYREPRLLPEQRPRVSLGEFFRGFWVSPKRYPDFAWAWAARFLVSLGNAVAVIYLLFFLQDKLGFASEEAGKRQATLIVIYTLGIVVTTVVAGKLSDRSGRRKVYVIVSSVIMAVAATLFAFAADFTLAMVAAAVLGLGYGVYLAVDQALITQVLPSAGDRARDLGVINIANSAPQVIAPIIAGGLIAAFGTNPGYLLVYVAAGLVTLAGAVAIRPIRSVP